MEVVTDQIHHSYFPDQLDSPPLQCLIKNILSSSQTFCFPFLRVFQTILQTVLVTYSNKLHISNSS